MCQGFFENKLEDLMTTRYVDASASDDEKKLYHKVCDFKPFFSDMLCLPDSIAKQFLSSQDDDGGQLSLPLPEPIAYFSLDWFSYSVSDLGPSRQGRFSPKSYSIDVSPNVLEDSKRLNVVLLHEMIHLFEFILDLVPSYYREMILFTLYKDLYTKIPDLDERISRINLSWFQCIEQEGGTHDLLFLLKSYDLDYKMKYDFGTVLDY